jgi:ADP-heptose:LPS heptosyltransferase
MKILVIQQKMIGDVLVSSIICNNLKSMYPDSQIDYLIYPFTVAAVEQNPNIDNIIFFEEKFRGNKKELLRFLIKIRKQNYDIVIDAYGKLESNIIIAFSGAEKKIGFHKWYTNFLYTTTIAELQKPYTNAGTAIENRLNLLKPLKPKISIDNKPKLFLTEKEIQNGKKILDNVDFSKKIFMISVLGSDKTKTYPLHFMAEILDMIIEQTDANLIFNYIPSQAKEAMKVFELCLPKTRKNIKIDIIPGSIREFLSITYHCNALIGNEGGAVNMAKALNKSTFTIFSTWIIKEAWNCFENGTTNVSVHLQDYKPELYGIKSAKEMKKESRNLYKEFYPKLFLHVLGNFLKSN